MNTKICQLICIILLVQLTMINGFPQQGKWKLLLNDTSIGQYNGVAKNLYKGTKIFIRVNCQPTGPTGESNEITIGWILRETQVMTLINILIFNYLNFKVLTYYMTKIFIFNNFSAGMTLHS